MRRWGNSVGPGDAGGLLKRGNSDVAEPAKGKTTMTEEIDAGAPEGLLSASPMTGAQIVVDVGDSAAGGPRRPL